MDIKWRKNNFIHLPLEAPLSFYNAPWNNSLEPNQGNIRQWLDNLYSKFQP